MKKLLFTLAFACIILVIGCNTNESKKTAKRAINPNGDSELALMMRKMFDEAYQIKEEVLDGKKVSTVLDHESILTAHATEPEKAASPEYKAFASTYLNAVTALNNANPDNVQERYDALVSNCKSCHAALCPGPLVKIKRLEK